MAFTPSSEYLEKVRRELYSAVIGDVLDRMGHHVHFLPAAVRAIDPAMVVVGRAAPVIVEDSPGTLADPFGRLPEAVDSLQQGDVYITNGGRTHYSLWGELMSTRALHRKAAGAVMNGYHRDTAGILALGFPTFSWGAYALDISFRGRVVDFGVPTRVGDVPVRPGDFVFGDRDGVLVIQEDLAEEALARAFEKVHGENLVRKAFREGMPAAEAWAKYGVM